MTLAMAALGDDLVTLFDPEAPEKSAPPTTVAKQPYYSLLYLPSLYCSWSLFGPSSERPSVLLRSLASADAGSSDWYSS